MFRKTTTKAAEEEISEDLLANVPELENAPDAAGPFAGFAAKANADELTFTVVDDEGSGGDVATAIPGMSMPPLRPVPFGEAPAITPTPFPLGGAAPAAPAAPLPVEVDPAALSMNVRDLVGQVRTVAENAFQQEMARVESNVGGLLQQMEARLAQAEQDLAHAKAEHARVKAETERKAEALRELKKALESI